MKKKVIKFKDYPEFTPNLTPREIFERGSFGGTYWRPIYSAVTKKRYKNVHRKYPFLKDLDSSLLLVRDFKEYDKSINTYGVKVGQTLEFWEDKGWIHPSAPYGWVQWYCNFYAGKRSDDDERQIGRWVRTAGPNSRFRRWLINLLKKQKKKYDDVTVSPRIRQTLQHWAYVLTEEDFV